MRSSIQAMARRVIAWTRWGAPRVMPSLPAFQLRCHRRLFDCQHCHSEAPSTSVAAAQIVEPPLAIIPQQHLSLQRLTSFSPLDRISPCLFWRDTSATLAIAGIIASLVEMSALVESLQSHGCKHCFYHFVV